MSIWKIMNSIELGKESDLRVICVQELIEIVMSIL